MKLFKNQSEWNEFDKILCDFFNIVYISTKYVPAEIQPLSSIPSWNKGLLGQKSHRYGIKWSEKDKEKLRKPKGVKRTEEHKTNLSNSLKGRKVVNKGQKGLYSWYNDGKKEFFLKNDDQQTKGLFRGRIKLLVTDPL